MDRIQRIADELEKEVYKDPMHGKIARDNFLYGVAQGKLEIIEKAVEWIINTYLGDYVTDEFGNGGIGDNVKLANDLRKALMEK